VTLLEVFKKLIVIVHMKVVISSMHLCLLLFAFIGFNTLTEGLFSNIYMRKLDTGFVY